jgi:hypothetical protein
VTSTMQSGLATRERGNPPERGDSSEPGGHHRGGGVCSGAVLDIGGDTGALVIYADELMVESEIEICPSGDLSKREHNVVRARRTLTGFVYAAVFPSLKQGEYSVLTRDLLPSHEVSVMGGSVSEVDCRTGAGI